MNYFIKYLDFTFVSMGIYCSDNPSRNPNKTVPSQS